MRTTVHIDGDILVYSAGFAAERGEYRLSWIFDGVEKVEFFPTRKELDNHLAFFDTKQYMVEFMRHPEPVEYALHNTRNIIDAILGETQANDYFVYLSGPTNFRDNLATIKPYKGNRDKTHKPVHGPAIREYLARAHPTVVSDNEEADDVIGYTHYAMYEKDLESSIIATMDKDLNMIPGHHYNFAKQEHFFVWDSEADVCFYKQLLTGDTTDNIQGVPGIGPKKAEKLLAPVLGDVSGMYQVALEAYKGNEKELLENARLLWIRRHKGEVWEPPTKSPSLMS